MSDTIPSLEWPVLDDDASRRSWYLAVISAYAELWEGHSSQPPCSEAALSSLETRLGCVLPAALRTYHKEFGALSLVETLCGVEDKYTPIQPLLNAYPGFMEMNPSADEIRLAEALIVFGDYLGNGNMFCFHRDSGVVYYFDHDSKPILTKFFDDTQTYLDALMLLTLAEVHNANELGEELLLSRFGDALVKKWLY